MTLDVVFADLLGITTASHIHCCNTTPTSPVATQVPSFIGFPLGVSSGSYLNRFRHGYGFVLQPDLHHQ